MKKKLYLVVVILALIGLSISSYLTYFHYTNDEIVCTLNTESCNEVLSGPYSILMLNIPNSVIGALGFSAIIILGILGFKRKIENLLIAFSSVALSFVLYLAYIVFFVIHSFCLWCFATWILTLSIFIISIVLKLK